jgi:hypothetical protein
MSEMQMSQWISVRNKWPEVAGEYRVKDCRREVEGTCFYDGYEWNRPEYDIPKKGSLLWLEYTVTHWMPNDH